MRVLATYNIKGGVGKTSTAVNLAYLSSRDGARTLLWDLDPQGAASFIFRIKPRVKGGGKGLVRRKFSLGDAIKGTDFDDLDLLPADFSYRNLDLLLDARSKPVAVLRQLLRPLAQDYDTVILDCPPGISLVSESVMYAADTLLIPLIPATLSLRTFDQLTDFVGSTVVRHCAPSSRWSTAARSCTVTSSQHSPRGAVMCCRQRSPQPR
jgi:cellulose biosynthesis protein BcsQ